MIFLKPFFFRILTVNSPSSNWCIQAIDSLYNSQEPNQIFIIVILLLFLLTFSIIVLYDLQGSKYSIYIIRAYPKLVFVLY